MDSQKVFSKREEDVIALLVEGKSNKQIALALNITVRTVEFHLGNVYSKLNVPSRSEAIVKLSNRQLWESTGNPGNAELGKTAVEFESQPAKNEREPFASRRRLPMKKLIPVSISLAAILAFAFLLRSQLIAKPVATIRNPAPSKASVLATYTPGTPTAIPSPNPTLSPKEQIIFEEQQLAAEYDQAVKAEIQNGQVEISKDPTSGKTIIHFQGDSNTKIALLFDAFNQRLQTLNQKYMALYIAEVQPTPFPTQSTEKENETYYQDLLQQYPAFFDQLVKDGPTVLIYDPNDGNYYNRIIGDPYAKSEIMTRAIETLHQAPQMAKVDQDANIDQIRQTLGNPDLMLTFQGVRGLANAPWIQAAVYEDDAGGNYWVAIESGRLAEIDPPTMDRVEVPAVDVKSIEAVRPLAEKIAATSSLRFEKLKKEMLYEQNGKGDIYFFRWDYRNKDWSGTDWAMMPPLLQIGMSADGRLVSYTNTLDLYH